MFADGDSGPGADALRKGGPVYVAGPVSGHTWTAARILSGTFDDQGAGERRFDVPGHGPCDRHDRSPSPSGSAAAT